MKTKESNIINTKSNSRGAAIFKRMIKDKKFISGYLRKGGTLKELSEKFN